MSSDQWEYLRVTCSEDNTELVREGNRFMVDRNYFWKAKIIYCYPNGDIYSLVRKSSVAVKSYTGRWTDAEGLKHRENSASFQMLFHSILGVLGGFGWELVDIQTSGGTWYAAFLKRKVQEGRATTEPSLPENGWQLEDEWQPD